ncbi:MAG: tRNA (adenosine(37)-N6)-threonylcarbamoyltransferase complex dimerization subunit type 1 TsaB [Kiritimatiellia bacterium]|jgi:tRNA threonylcarbamoyladenosine biosynthesis protein TsaB
MPSSPALSDAPPNARRWTLALERSSRPPSMALFRGLECVAGRGFPSMAAHGATAWAGALRDLLDETGVRPSELALLAVGLGPGSFSGTRSAIAFLHGVGLPARIPLAGVGSAAAAAFAAARALPAGHTVAVAGDARRSRWWRATFTTLDAPGTPFGRLLRRALPDPVPPSHDASDFSLVHPDVPSLRSGVPDGATWLEIETLVAPALASALTVPTARHVGELVLSEPAAALPAPLPIYLQPALLPPKR